VSFAILRNKAILKLLPMAFCQTNSLRLNSCCGDFAKRTQIGPVFRLEKTKPIELAGDWFRKSAGGLFWQGGFGVGVVDCCKLLNQW
jgi:hypothetical protein